MTIVKGLDFNLSQHISSFLFLFWAGKVEGSNTTPCLLDTHVHSRHSLGGLHGLVKPLVEFP
jgi:hypothetical protein